MRTLKGKKWNAKETSKMKAIRRQGDKKALEQFYKIILPALIAGAALLAAFVYFQTNWKVAK